MFLRYGVWLMVGLCTPNPDTPDEILGRLLSVLFHWFHVTSFSYTGKFVRFTVPGFCGYEGNRTNNVLAYSNVCVSQFSNYTCSKPTTKPFVLCG